MAPTVRLYRAARLGNGSRLDPYRAALSRYIVADGSGADFEQLERIGMTHFYCLATCEPAVHATCAADPDIIALSPEVASVSALRQWSKDPIGSALNATLRNAIEANGIPVDDLGNTTPRKLVFRRIASMVAIGGRIRGDYALVQQALGGFPHTTEMRDIPAGIRAVAEQYLSQRGLDISWMTASTTLDELAAWLRGLKAEAMAVLDTVMDLQVSQIPQARRDRASQWLGEWGITRDWITGTTTVREILKHVVTTWRDLRPARFVGLEF